MQQVKCVRPRAGVKAGDTAEVPDGAAVSDLYWEPVTAAARAPAPPPASPPAAAAPAKEGGTS